MLQLMCQSVPAGCFVWAQALNDLTSDCLTIFQTQQARFGILTDESHNSCTLRHIYLKKSSSAGLLRSSYLTN